MKVGGKILNKTKSIAAEHGERMTRQRRILGMTTAQVGILAGLGAAVCLLFVVAAWLVTRGGFQPAPVSTLPPQMTATPFVLPTITPTLTATPVPYEQLIPVGWNQHKTALIEIWMPPNFKGADEAADEELRLQDSDRSTSLYRSSVLVLYQPLGTDSLDAYIDKQVQKMDPAARVVERRKVSLNGTEAVRMLYEARVNTVDVNVLGYLIQDGDTAWVIFYAAQINRYYEMLSVFEQSAQTFRIVH